MSVTIHTSIVGGRSVRFIECGDAASANVLVLVHAFPLSERLFQPQCGAFPGWRLLAPALPGFDGSDLLERAYVDEYARHFLEWLDALGVRRAVFGGVSIGGHVMFALLRLAPERVSGVILANTRSGADSEEARAGRERMIQAVAERGTSAVVPDMVSRLLGPTSHQTRKPLEPLVRGMIEAQTPAAITAALNVLMKRPDSTPMLPGIRVPALVIAGEEDTIAPLREMEQMAEAIPGARFVSIPRTGHLSNMEEPEAFNSEVARWLGGLVAT
jgi:pimeloyl-ACP methyl ester carboxylesterase